MIANARTAIAWLLPFAAVAGVLGWETHWGRALDAPAPPPTAAAPAPVAVALLPEYALQGGAEARRETVERTLFNPTRRPAPPAPAPAAAAAQMPRGQFALTGTTLVDGKATAFLRELQGGKARRVRKGETINGMLVEDVRADRVKLSMNGETEELVMKIAAGPRATVQPAQPHVAGPAVPGGATPTANAGTQPAGVTPQVAELLAQRRRAARAAEAANAANAANAAANGGSAANAAPVPVPLPSPTPAPALTPPVPATAANPRAARQDQGWSSVYQRMLRTPVPPAQ